MRVGSDQLFRHACAEAAVHTVVALYHAARTGAGQHVDVSAQAAGVRTTMNAVDFELLEGREVTRLGPGVAYAPGRPRQIFACADGHVTYMAAIGPLGGPGLALMRQLAEQDGIEVPESLPRVDFCELTYGQLAAEGRTERFIVELESMVDGVLASRTKAELYRMALDHLLLLAPINTVADLRLDDQLAARRYLATGRGRRARGRASPFPGPWARLGRARCATRPGRPTSASTTREVREALRRTHARPSVAPAGAGAGPPDADDDPFAGLKVLDMSWVGVGPITARYLADYGATVVKLEAVEAPRRAARRPAVRRRQSGAQQQPLLRRLQRRKLGVGLDLDDAARPRGGARLAALGRRRHRESSRPRRCAAWGWTTSASAERNPSVVMLSTCMQGQTGPRRRYRGFGNLMAGAGRLLRAHRLARPGPVDDLRRLHRLRVAALLRHRPARRARPPAPHGRGPAPRRRPARGGAAVPRPRAARPRGQRPGRRPTRQPRPPFRAPRRVPLPCRGTRTGRRAVAGPRLHRRRAVVGAGGGPRLAGLGDGAGAGRRRRPAPAEDELDRRLAEWTADRSAEELFAALQPRVAAAPVRAPGALLADPQLRHRGYFPVLDHPVMGPVPYHGVQGLFSRTPGRPRKAAPCVGEDTWTVLTELLGYDPDEVAALLAAARSRSASVDERSRWSWRLQPEARHGGRQPSAPGQAGQSVDSSIDAVQERPALVATAGPAGRGRRGRRRAPRRRRLLDVPQRRGGDVRVLSAPVWRARHATHRVELDVVHVAQAAQRVGIERPTRNADRSRSSTATGRERALKVVMSTLTDVPPGHRGGVTVWQSIHAWENAESAVTRAERASSRSRVGVGNRQFGGDMIRGVWGGAARRRSIHAGAAALPEEAAAALAADPPPGRPRPRTWSGCRAGRS